MYITNEGNNVVGRKSPPPPVPDEPPSHKTVLVEKEPLIKHIERTFRKVLSEYVGSKPLYNVEPLADIQDVASCLGVSVRTVETLIAEGDLVPIWVRGQRRFTSDAIEAYIRHHVGDRSRGGRQ